MSTAWLQTRNNSHDVLAADVLVGDATIEVTTAATQFPAAYPYRVTVWDAATHTDPGDDADMEIMQVTGRAGNVLNVTRAQEGTAAYAWVLLLGVVVPWLGMGGWPWLIRHAKSGCNHCSFLSLIACITLRLASSYDKSPM